MATCFVQLFSGASHRLRRGQTVTAMLAVAALGAGCVAGPTELAPPASLTVGPPPTAPGEDLPAFTTESTAAETLLPTNPGVAVTQPEPVLVEPISDTACAAHDFTVTYQPNRFALPLTIVLDAGEGYLPVVFPADPDQPGWALAWHIDPDQPVCDISFIPYQRTSH